MHFLFKILIVGIITANGFGTYLYNEVLRTDLGLWLNNAAKTPRLSVVQNNLANVLLDLGRTAEALPLLTAAIEHDRFNNPGQKSKTYYNLGRAYEHHYGDQDERTLTAFRISLATSPLHLKSRLRLARHYQLEGEFEAAETLLMEAVPLKGSLEEVEWRNSLSMTQLKQGKLEAAYKNALIVLSAKPDVAPPKAVIAEIERRWGRKRMALRWWVSVLNSKPNHLDALLAMTQLYYENGEIEKMAPMIRRTMGARPANTLAEIMLERRKLAHLIAWTHDEKLLAAAYGKLFFGERGKTGLSN
jgi:tetratricopeptide (TPR) repeat protein